MTITKQAENTTLVLAISGRIDTTTAPQLEGEIQNSVAGITSLVLDFKEVEYISSAGLRVLLSTQKLMKKQGEMVLKNVCQDILDIFEMTGFSDFLTIEN